MGNNHYEFVLGPVAKDEESSDEIPPWRGKKCDNLSRLFSIKKLETNAVYCPC